MQQVDTDPPSLPVGTEVSAKYKGAFCEAKVSKVVRNIKVKVAYKQGLGSGVVSDDIIKVAPGQLRIGAVVEVRHPDRKELVEGTVTKIQDCSQYTVVFDDGDITTLRRTALCLKSGRHFNESETLDQLPLTHPEHFGNPVVGGRRGRRRGQLNDDSSDDEDESDTKEVVNEKEEHIGKVVCIETETKKKDKEKWFPGLVVAPTAQATVRIRVKDEYLVRSFKDGRYYTVPKKEANEFTREAAAKQDGQAVQAALEYLDSGVLPPHWDRESLFGLSNSSSEEDGELESDSSDDEPREEKDRFVAQLYKYMDDRGTPLNKVPSIQNRDVDLYRLFRAVQKCGGYNRVTSKNQWKSIAIRLGFTPVTVSVTNLVKQAFKKFLQPYGEFHRKLGCSMLMTPRNSNRSKGRSLVRANSVASPKPMEINKEPMNTKGTGVMVTVSSSSSSSSSVSSIQNITITSVVPLSAAAAISVVTPSGTEESENTSESSLDTTKNKRKTSIGRVKGLIHKYEEKSNKEDCDMPLSKIKAAVSSRTDDREKEKEVSIKDDSPSSVLPLRESSPPGTSVANKKEKNQKKQTPQSDDKRGKRKKDDITVEKVDAGDFIVEVGDKLKVYYHEKKVTYEAKVIEISLQRGPPIYLVHYTGWNNRYDEWVPRERIAENLTKGSKHKGRTSNIGSMEKQKDNPPKPPTAASIGTAGPSNPNMNLLSGASTSTKVSVSAKRGRGRSDSLPPRSTTPSSIASNSSRTKSPATASLKRRPMRTLANSARRTSANVSDMSLPTESDTDSDEPVRRPTRGTKDIVYKSDSLSGKVTHKAKLSGSVPNSQSDTEDDEDEDMPSSILRSSNNSTSNLNAKGRNYDLNQIRSELRGFQGLKSPSSVGDDEIVCDIKDESPIKNESIFDAKEVSIAAVNAVVETNIVTDSVKVDQKPDLKEEIIKSSTDISSETESFGDDDSQSSGKTTTLENMTKKFQQKIKAGKQQAMELHSIGKASTERVPRVVEKIIQDSLAEKLQESLKAKPPLKQEECLCDTIVCKSESDVKEESKKGVPQTIDSKNKGTSSNQTRASSTQNASKYASVIVEKPITSVKKMEAINNKKSDVNKKGVPDSSDISSKQFIEPLLKYGNKTESPAACSPSSSSSSSSSSRSLPDMSKLDISGGSSASPLYAIPNRDTKLISIAPKSISPDIYEFKDPEPFEFEIRKPPAISTNVSPINPVVIGASSLTVNFRKQNQKSTEQQIVGGDKQPPSQSSIAALINRKKRGSPMKEANVDKSKQFKIDEKLSLGMSDAKINYTISTSSAVAKCVLTSQTKTLTTNSISSVQSHCISSALQKAADKATHISFDTLRKSPGFNVNINALNEELAQTVQETTRALTDAFQAPHGSSIAEAIITPPKLEPLKKADENSLGTPHKIAKSNISTPGSPITTSVTKAIIGSPFVETRKDLSNVFELSAGEGSISSNDLKDNKFEFENAKILLSATTGAFELDATKFENKPTSIADKVLKAINQRREEDKQKLESKSEKIEENNTSEDLTIALVSATIPKRPSDELLDAGIVSIQPLNISTDLVGPSIGILGGNNSLGPEKLPLISASLSRRTPLTSPETKLGILESITVKNNDLTETIQKLECAILRKTPVSGLSVTTTPTSSLAPNTFSDDSTDSTDSERRLVIEDLADEVSEMLKSPNGTQNIVESKTIPSSIIPNKIDVGIAKTVPGNNVSQIDSQTSIPPHVAQLTNEVSLPTVCMGFNHKMQESCTVSTIEVCSLSAAIQNSSDLVSTTNSEEEIMKCEKQAPQKLLQQNQEELPFLSTENRENNGARINKCIVPRDNVSDEVLSTVTTFSSTTSNVPLLMTTVKSVREQIQRAVDVVPIVVPDIPVSVVVASSAVASVKAATQSVVRANSQNPISSANKSSHQAISIATATANEVNTMPSADAGKKISTGVRQLNLPIAAAFSQLESVTANSGFYLDARTELRPEDGVKPIMDVQRQNTGDERSTSKDAGVDFGAEELISSCGGDVHNDSINLLCEETIPGSPAPAFGGKEESLPQLRTENSLVLEGDDKNFINRADPIASMRSSVLLANTNVNSSPNDSASQDESSEDVKKNLGVENEISPRKRRRTRKQSEITNVADQQTKRRRQVGCSKRVTAGSDSDENSDTISQRITISARHQFQQQHMQLQQPQTTSGTQPCPYNFLVQLDPNMSSDQCIAILLKQIQELRKTYNAIKGDLASIDRRRKKLRRREREKKQLTNQQSIKIGS